MFLFPRLLLFFFLLFAPLTSLGRGPRLDPECDPTTRELGAFWSQRNAEVLAGPDLKLRGRLDVNENCMPNAVADPQAFDCILAAVRLEQKQRLALDGVELVKHSDASSAAESL